MPNHIHNILRVVEGTDSQIRKLNQFLLGKDKNVDFNKITPMPKWVYRGNLGSAEEEKYGKNNCWYEWSIENWGTKWNAYHTKVSGDGETIEFDAAWAGVPDLMSKLARIFPKLKFEYLYADEDIGYNLGHYEIQDTKIVKYSIENDIQFACDVWGRDYNEYMKELEEYGLQ